MSHSFNLVFVVSILWYPRDFGNCTHTDHLGNNGAANNGTKIHPCSQKTSTKNFILAIFSASVLIISILGNVLTIALIQSYVRLRTHVPHVFVTSLAVADLGVSFFVTTVKVDYYMNNGGFCHSYGLCVLFHLTDSLFPIVSITNLVIIGADRWYAIAYPYEYVENMTINRAKCATLGVWTYSMLWTLLGVFSWEDASQIAFKIKKVGKHRFCYSLNRYYHTTVISVIYIFPMAIITFLYIIVVSIAKKHVVSILKSTPNNQNQKLRRRHRFISDTKAAKTVGVVFMAFTVCWLPHIILVIIHYWFPDILRQFYYTNDPLYDVTTTVISNILPTLNSCINPFIYFISSNHFRRAFNDVVCRRLLKRPNHSIKKVVKRKIKHEHSQLTTSVVIATRIACLTDIWNDSVNCNSTNYKCTPV